MKDTAGLDKSSLKIVTQLIAEISIATNEDTAERVSFFECAPGLKDLIQISASTWEESQIMDTTRRVRATRNTRKVVDSDDEMDLDEEDEEDDDEEEDDESED